MAPQIFLVDDDDAVREALSLLFASAELAVTPCVDGDDLLHTCTPEQPGCIVLDLNLPGMDGLEIQSALRARGIELPIIFLSGKGSVTSAASALKAGAFDFIEKPAEPTLLLERVQDALRRDAQRREHAAGRRQAQQRLAQLTAREREVTALTLEGLANKQIASRLGISYRTVEIHRARVMQKMGAANVLALDRMLNHGDPGPAGDDAGDRRDPH